MALNDQKIIEAVLSGKDESILSDLYKYLLPEIVKYVKNNNGRREEAEDIFQDGVIILLKKIKMNEFDKTYSIKGFFFTVCKNLYINKVRRDKKVDNNSVPGESFDVEGEDLYLNYFNEEKTRVVKEMLGQLGEQCRQLMDYVFYHNLDMKTIAELMGLKSADVAKSIHYRCKQKLVVLMEKNKFLEQYLREQ